MALHSSSNKAPKVVSWTATLKMAEFVSKEESKQKAVAAVEAIFER